MKLAWSDATKMTAHAISSGRPRRCSGTSRADPVAGVVDQDIDAPELVQSLRDGAVDLPSVTDVALDGEGAAALGAHEVGDRLQRVLTAAARHHVGADSSELDGDRAADPLARPGHDRDAIAERVSRERHLTG